jgi:hypothetical protein
MYRQIVALVGEDLNWRARVAVFRRACSCR